MYGMIIGSITPWIEAICLKNGASKLVSVEYGHMKTDHKNIKYKVNKLKYV